MPKPFPREFREDVVRVARNREPGVHLKQIAADFGVSESCLTGWLAKADVEDGAKPGVTAAQSATERELRRRVRLLEQENEERARRTSPRPGTGAGSSPTVRTSAATPRRSHHAARTTSPVLDGRSRWSTVPGREDDHHDVSR